VRIAAILNEPVYRVNVTPEWLAKIEAKLRAYERKRAQRREESGIINLAYPRPPPGGP
jgi:hypothetical protein